MKETILIPLFANEIALDPAGPDIAEFSIDNALSQVAAIFSALGENRVKTMLESIGLGGYDSVTPLVTRKLSTIEFLPGGNIIIGQKTIEAKNISDQQRNLLRLLYTSPGFAVSFTRAMAIIWNDSLMDENTIKQGMWRLKKALQNAGIDTDNDIRIYQKKMTVEYENGESEADFFICLDGVTKS